jgi:hypothetical protein
VHAVQRAAARASQGGRAHLELADLQGNARVGKVDVAGRTTPKHQRRPRQAQMRVLRRSRLVGEVGRRHASREVASPRTRGRASGMQSSRNHGTLCVTIRHGGAVPAQTLAQLSATTTYASQGDTHATTWYTRCATATQPPHAQCCSAMVDGSGFAAAQHIGWAGGQSGLPCRTGRRT